ncbi:MAG: hypothetical protein CBD16_00530 [Betaproteobacteria bacterium TMED156]|nr:MAG: hypothetical protein CBD16_00530 [Betaproteobacteria bacterium TMED156]|tara:strand:- start:479 stop:1558 length:1080 start_codon:yes stop_codon:yes gene_type:complete
MKIAVLLRGKQNFSRTTSALFKKMVIEKFPHIDFKFFIHTWNSLPVSPGVNNRLKQKTHHKSVILEKISHWDPILYELSEEKELLNVIKKILKKQSIDQTYHSWAQEQLDSTKKLDLVSPFFIDRSKCKYIKKIDNIMNKPDVNNPNHIDILKIIFSGFYLTGQMYSAMKAFSLYKLYAAQNEYTPDLVICTRPDVVFNLVKGSFDSVIEMLDKTHYGKISNVICSEVMTLKGQAWVQDYAFITDNKGANEFLGGDPVKRLLDLAFNHRARTTGLLDSSGMEVHMLWPILGHKCSFKEAGFFLTTLARREFSENDFTNYSHKKIFLKVNNELTDWFKMNKLFKSYSNKILLSEIKRIIR